MICECRYQMMLVFNKLNVKRKMQKLADYTIKTHRLVAIPDDVLRGISCVRGPYLLELTEGNYPELYSQLKEEGVYVVRIQHRGRRGKTLRNFYGFFNQNANISTEGGWVNAILSNDSDRFIRPSRELFQREFDKIGILSISELLREAELQLRH